MEIYKKQREHYQVQIRKQRVHDRVELSRHSYVERQMEERKQQQREEGIPIEAMDGP